MTINLPKPSTLTGIDYAILRYEGASPGMVRQQLELAEAAVARLERLFLNNPGEGEEAMRPAFAHHGWHVRAVKAEGGYPVLPETAR